MPPCKNAYVSCSKPTIIMAKHKFLLKAFPKNILSAFIVKTGNWECHPKLVMVRKTCWLANIPIIKF